jgi:hypothetical protein
MFHTVAGEPDPDADPVEALRKSRKKQEWLDAQQPVSVDTALKRSPGWQRFKAPQQ